MTKKNSVIKTHKPATFSEFKALDKKLRAQRFIPIDLLKPGAVKEISQAVNDPAVSGASSMAACFDKGEWSNGPLSKVAWSFDSREDSVVSVKGDDGKDLGLGYIKWGAKNSIPSVIPPLAMSSPYTSAPLRYIADLITGLGVRLMYHFPDGKLCEYRDAGERLLKEIEALEPEGSNFQPVLPAGMPAEVQPKQDRPALVRLRKAYEDWKTSWYGKDEDDDVLGTIHVPGAKEFLEENNTDLHFSQCQEDGTKLDIYYPSVGFQKGRAGRWGNPKIVRIGFFPASIVRMEKRDKYNYSNHCYVSDRWRTLGSGTVTTAGETDQTGIVMYPAAMPQNMLQKLRDIVDRNQRTAVSRRPTWVICPTFYPSGNKPYYPQPAWWSIFSSKAFDFSATILYDKYKARENATSWGKVLYVSLDYLSLIFADMGIEGDKEKKEAFINELDKNVEQFLQRRENNGKMMRQFMWIGPDGKEHKNVEVVDVTNTTNDAAKAGKDELELSTSPIFLALQVDPRLVGVPMVAASNGGTALREMHLLKQQQLNVHQRNYCRFLNNIATYNGWANAEWHVVQQTLTTLDNSKTGTVETVAGEGA